MRIGHLLLKVILLLILVSCATTPPDVNTSLVSTKTDTTAYGVQLRLPAGWKIRDERTGETGVLIFIRKPKFIGSWVIRTPESGYDLAGYIKDNAAERILKRYAEDLPYTVKKITTTEGMTTQGRTYQAMTYNMRIGRSNNRNFTFYYIEPVPNETYWYWGTVGNRGVFASTEKEVAAVASGITFL